MAGRLVARSVEWETLWSAVDRAAAGQSATVVIAVEAGVGKNGAARRARAGLRVDHPRFFAFMPMPSNPVGVGDPLAAGFSVFAGTWLASPGAAMVELVVLDWLRELCGLPPGPRACSSAAARRPT